MKIEVGFGSGTQSLEMDNSNLLGILLPDTSMEMENEEVIVRNAMEHPIGSHRLSKIVYSGQTVAVVTSDITRPVPSKLLLPFVLNELNAGGVRDEDITVVFALGIHRKHTEEEQRRLVGDDIFDRVRCMDGDKDDCVDLGVTSRGTPVNITRIVAEADARVCLGNIEFHYFAGYSGGAKAIMPGVSDRNAIQKNHRLMVMPEACAGRIEGNPIRQDIEEAAAICGVDFILNVILDEHKRIVGAVAGNVTDAHRKGCLILDSMYSCRMDRKADIVIVSQGGTPKDINLYQTQKALDNAKNAVRDGGIIILVGSCKEGFGEKVFEEWMLTSPSPEYMIERISRDFQLGGHKAASIAMVLVRARIYLVSDMDKDTVKRIFMEPFMSVQEAYNAALKEMGKDAQVLVIPYGGSTLPCLMNDN